MPTYTYTANPTPLTQEELDALAAQQAAMGAAVPAGGYKAQPPPQQTQTAPAGPPPQPAYIPESSAYQPAPPPVGPVTQATNALDAAIPDGSGWFPDTSGIVPPVGAVGDALLRGDVGAAAAATAEYLSRPVQFATDRQGEASVTGKPLVPAPGDILADPSRLWDVLPGVVNTGPVGAALQGQQSLDDYGKTPEARARYEQGGGAAVYEGWLQQGGVSRTPPWEDPGRTADFLRGVAIDAANDPTLPLQTAFGLVGGVAKLGAAAAARQAGRRGMVAAGEATARGVAPSVARSTARALHPSQAADEAATALSPPATPFPPVAPAVNPRTGQVLDSPEAWAALSHEERRQARMKVLEDAVALGTDPPSTRALRAIEAAELRSGMGAENLLMQRLGRQREYAAQLARSGSAPTGLSAAKAAGILGAGALGVGAASNYLANGPAPGAQQSGAAQPVTPYAATPPAGVAGAQGNQGATPPRTAGIDSMTSAQLSAHLRDNPGDASLADVGGVLVGVSASGTPLGFKDPNQNLLILVGGEVAIDDFEQMVRDAYGLDAWEWPEASAAQPAYGAGPAQTASPTSVATPPGAVPSTASQRAPEMAPSNQSAGERVGEEPDFQGDELLQDFDADGVVGPLDRRVAAQLATSINATLRRFRRRRRAKGLGPLMDLDVPEAEEISAAIRATLDAALPGRVPDRARTAHRVTGTDIR